MVEIDKFDLERLKADLDFFKRKYNLSALDVIGILQEDDVLPLSTLRSQLSPLEAVAKYFRQSREMEFTHIAKLLGKSSPACWTAYKNAMRKHPKEFLVEFSKHDMPLSELHSEKLSLLELIVRYLREKHGLKFSRIAELIGRDPRTVWTAYKRMESKTR
jgi:hypothetical protein